MNKLLPISVRWIWMLLTLTSSVAAVEEETTHLKELDAYWMEVSRTVKEGDFAGYAATCHEEGVLVSGKKQTSSPLKEALKKWKPGFVATKSGAMKANVSFRFSKRMGDATTAHETGMFCYSSTDEQGVTKTVYVHLEALLVKREKWQILMEYQKSEGTVQEWNKLAQEKP